MQNLVEQSHGHDVVQLLINNWVEDKHKANSVCLDDGSSSLANNDVGSDGGNGGNDTETGDDSGDGGSGGGGGGGGSGDSFIWPRLINTEED